MCTRFGFLLLVILTSWQSASGAEPPSDFSGHQVVRVRAATEKELELLLTLADDFWNCHGPGIGENDVRVSPAQRQRLAAAGLPFRVLIEDVQPLIDAERLAAERGGGRTFDNYMNLAAVQSYMNQLVALRPDLAQPFTAGTSVEGRPIVGLRIGAPAVGTEPGILMFGGQHAREWITVATALYVADQLIRTYDTDPLARELVDRCDWRIIPVMNPDGYEYSWNTFRFWRKNRRNNGGSFGVDLNRNWGDHWCLQGASSDPPSDTYCGPSPFSEPETQAIRNILIANPNIVAFTDVHSYSQLIMWAWGWTPQLAPDDAELRYMGGYMRDVVRDVHGMSYGPGPVYTTIYPASGTSVDYAYGQHGILAMTYELRDRGQFGFLLPAEQIAPTCEEIYPSLLWYANYASTTFTTPGAFDTVEPPAGALAVDPQPTFIWTPSPLAVSYRVRVDDDPLFRTPDIDVSRIRATQYTAAAPLEEGRTYYWRVTAENFVGATLAPPASPATFVTARDCNHNGVDDALDLAAGAEQDCNGNGRPDSCDLSTEFRVASLDLTPINASSPQAYSYAARPALGDVTLRFEAAADLNLDSERIDVLLNDAPIGNLYGPGGADCPLTPSVATLTLPFGQYNNLLTGGVATLRMVATPAVGELCPFPSYISVAVSCEAAPISADEDHDGVPDECGGLRGDMNCDGAVNVLDINAFVLALADPAAYQQQFPDCLILNGDIDGDGATTVLDINGFVALIVGRSR